VIGTEIEQFDRGAAERDNSLIAYRLVRQRRVRVFERSQMLRDLLVRDDRGPSVLECLAAGDVIVVMVAVDQIFDRLVGDLLDLGSSGNRVGDFGARYCGKLCIS